MDALHNSGLFPKTSYTVSFLSAEVKDAVNDKCASVEQGMLTDSWREWWESQSPTSGYMMTVLECVQIGFLYKLDLIPGNFAIAFNGSRISTLDNSITYKAFHLD